MAVYERFQVLSAGRQNLFQPDSPVWVSRVQLSLDRDSGKRLLQARMVNLSERTVRQVFLRIRCLDRERRQLAQLEMVPMGSLRVLPGRVFGDDKPVELTPKGTCYAEAYAQRVRFADGGTWDEDRPQDYIAFSDPEPVKPEDLHYRTLASRALSGGVRNDCYFRAQQGLWLCTCGLPNASRSLRCAHCGAERLWLEQHMDPNRLEGTPGRGPETGAPTAIPAPIVPSPAPSREDYGPAAQPTIILQSPEREEGPAPRPARAGKIAALVLAALLLCALGICAAVRFLMPWLRYREALREQSAGHYDQAVAMFRELGDYKDSPAQIDATLARSAVALMNEGRYQQALEILEPLQGYDNYKADCLYSLGVLAYNDKEPEKAMDYVEQLRQRYPDYERTEELAQYCSYSLGVAAMEAAQGMEPSQRIGKYEAAKELLTQAGDYGDSADKLLECDYQMALAMAEDGQLQEAVEAFAALDYRDAAAQRQRRMYNYAMEHLEGSDPASLDYLKELAGENYPGAQALLDRFNGRGFLFWLSEGETESPQQISDLSQLSIHYSVEQQDEEGAVPVLLLYSLPDGREGRAMLNNDRSARGSKAWTEIPFPTGVTKSGPITLRFYDAARGQNVEPLETLEIQYVYEPEASSQSRPSGQSDSQSGSKSSGKSGSQSGGKSGSQSGGKSGSSPDTGVGG